jgi:hypothetical protein
LVILYNTRYPLFGSHTIVAVDGILFTCGRTKIGPTKLGRDTKQPDTEKHDETEQDEASSRRSVVTGIEEAIGGF